MIDGTPVLDIKPYLPYADCIPGAKAGYASTAPEASLVVQFSNNALQQIRDAEAQYPELQNLIRQVIELDPRPAYINATGNRLEYGVKLMDFDIQWQVEDNTATVLSLHKM